MPGGSRRSWRVTVRSSPSPPALCSRRPRGTVEDPAWKSSFLKKAYASQRQVVPVFVEGELSDFFYGVANWRRRLGLRFNIEMLWLPDEMPLAERQALPHRGGRAPSAGELPACGTLAEQTEYVRKRPIFGRKLRAETASGKKRKFAPPNPAETHSMTQPIIPPVERGLLKAELTPARKGATRPRPATKSMSSPRPNVRP